MIEVKKGHVYDLRNLKEPGVTRLTFHQDPHLHQGERLTGPSTQEVLRACIARVKALDQEEGAPENKLIIGMLRYAIIQFELRALRRKLERDPAGAEALATTEDGHTFTIWDELA